jgi:hypothetical protein
MSNQSAADAKKALKKASVQERQQDKAKNWVAVQNAVVRVAPVCLESKCLDLSNCRG